jgi:uncharacterized membrane protein SirB2
VLQHYLQIKQAHVALILISGGLFAARGLAVLAGLRSAMAASIRYVSYGIDSALLASALLLLVILELNPLVVPWLAVKLILLVMYVVLGSLALKRARQRRDKLLAYLAALACYAFMYTVARTHHPLGALQPLAG